jgi:SPP1 gp7 family putative phage head morphogenesis protein
MPTKTSNEEFQDAMLRHQTYLLRYAGNVRNKMLAILQRTEESLSDKIRSRLAGNKGLTTSAELRRLNALMESIRKIREPAWKKANEVMREDMIALSSAESVSVDGIVKIALPVQLDTVMPSARLLRSIAVARPFQGQILADWSASMEADDLRKIHNAIQLGMTAGEDMATIARRVIGTEALQFDDGVMQMTRQQVQAVVRTAVQHVANHSRTAWFLENSDIVTTERFVATLDSRTTPICRANDGKEYPLGKGPVPPLHFQCRSLRIAALDGVLAGERPAKPFVERELVDEYARENGLGKVRNRDDLPRGTKGDYDKWARKRIGEMVGPVPADTTYNEWLKSQSKTFQDDTLGTTKAKLFRDGGLQLDKFVDRNGNELTLEQLASKEKEAFRAAGLNPDDF